MNSIAIALAFTIAYAAAQISIPPGYKDKNPQFYKWSKQSRFPRDITWDRQVGNGKVFGTLGGNDMGLYGRGGYRQDIFNDHHGRLEGQAYGSRVLSPYGDSSSMGGRLDWANDNARAAVDVNKQIHGRTNVQTSGSGQWQLDKNTRLSAEGYVQKQLGPGRPDLGVKAEIEHRF